MTARFDISGFIGEGEATALEISLFLAVNPGPVEMVVNSAGGIAWEGAAIAAELARHGGVTCLVRGIAASAASYILTGAAAILMHEDALLMIHEPSAFTGGTSEDLHQAAEVLEKLTAVYAAGYARASGHPVARIAAWMKAETWMTADEALALNFCDQLKATQDVPAMVAVYDYAKFRAAPANLVALALKNGWATVSPDQSNKEI